MTAAGEEVEAGLRVTPGGGEEVATAVAELEEVAGRRLRRRRPQDLLDVYLDTPGRSLEADGVALRLRRRGDRWVVGFKGEGRRLPGGGTARPEDERAWSPAAREEVRRVVAAHGGPDVPGRGDRPPTADAGDAAPGGEASPVADLLELGLEVVQRRRTRRRPSLLLPRDGGPGGDGDPVGEVAVDRVEYRPGGEGGDPVVHREVEVEGRGARADDVVAEVAAALLRRFPDGLRRWDHSKLATGEALRRLAERRALAGIVGPDRGLTQLGYARLEAMLEGPGVEPDADAGTGGNADRGGGTR